MSAKAIEIAKAMESKRVFNRNHFEVLRPFGGKFSRALVPEVSEKAQNIKKVKDKR